MHVLRRPSAGGHRLPFPCLEYVLALSAALLLPLGAAAAEPALELAKTESAKIEQSLLQVLDSDQLQAFVDGVGAEDILLANGESLADYLDRRSQSGRASLALHTLEPCVLTDSAKAGQKPIPGVVQSLLVRGPDSDLSELGGSPEGCGLPGLIRTGTTEQSFWTSAARALLISVEIRDAVEAGSLSIWPAGSPKPAGSSVTFEPQQVTTVPSLIVPICDQESADPCRDGDLHLLIDADAEIRVAVHGYLEPLDPSLGSGADSGTADIEMDTDSKSLTEPFWEKRTDNDDIHYTDGRVGIGTDSPDTALHVVGSDAGALISQPSNIQGVSNYFEPDFPTLTLKRGSSSRGSTLALGNQTGSTFLYGSHGGFKIYDSERNLRLFLKANGFLGLGTNDPQKTLHVDGSFILRDPTDSGILLRTLQRAPTGYAGGGPHDTQVMTLNTPYENTDSGRSRSGIVLGSPEIWGGESAYLYGFGSKNIRLGTINDSHRRAEIEIYNNNTSQGKIFFRTGVWRDPSNIPGSETNVRMMIDQLGRVGVGTTNPQEPFHVNGTARIDNTIKIGAMESSMTDGGNGRLKFIAKRAVGTSTGQAFTFSTCDSESNCFNRLDITGGGIAFRSVTHGEAMRINDANNVGIGTVVPSERLEVDGNIKLSGNLVSDGDICIGSCGT